MYFILVARQQDIKLDKFAQQNTHCRTAILQNSSLGAPNFWFPSLSGVTIARSLSGSTRDFL